MIMESDLLDRMVYRLNGIYEIMVCLIRFLKFVKVVYEWETKSWLGV